MQKPPAIYIEKASLSFGGHILFQDLTCTIAAGETTCLLGPSGIGKSSLLRLIAGLNQHKATGIIRTDDEQPLQNRIAYMAQTDLLMPWLSVLDNVLLGYRLRQPIAKAKTNTTLINQAKDLLTKIGLSKNIHQFPHQLSGGMRQRVALARTLIEDKPVVLMDEPFSALDTATRLQLQNLTAELLKNKTVFLITHDPFEALRLGHHIFIMQGSPARLEQLTLPNQPPRSVTDTELLYWQGQILERLMNASETTSC